MPYRKSRKRKTGLVRAVDASAADELVPSEEFARMILDEIENEDWVEIDIDDFQAGLRASTDLDDHLEPLQQKSLSYLTKAGAPKDEDEAMSWLLRHAARGDADAQHYLGLMYATRRQEASQNLGLRDRINAEAKQAETNATEAMFWFAQAANRGHSDSTLIVGLMYDAGRGCQRDHAESVKWIQKAADQGCEAARKRLHSLQS